MNNKVKKIALIIVAALLLATIAAAVVACDKGDAVTYVYGNGTQPDKTIEIFDGKIYRPESPVRDGYTFTYWALEGEDEPFDFDNRTVTGRVKLLAIWDPNLTFIEDDVTFVFDGGRPDHVKKGATISFRVQFGDDYDGNGAQICANEVPLTPDADGVYSYTVQEPTQFAPAGGVKKYNITWRAAEGAEFLFAGASAPAKLAAGTEVEFGVRVSPFYQGTPVVRAASQVLQADSDGVYRFTVAGDMLVTVTGIEFDNTRMEGKGTEAKPYLITRPSHLQMITESINSGDSTYMEAYIRLDSDLDLCGETLSPIGQYSGEEQIPFLGVFDGNDHKIANFTLNYDADNQGSVSALFALLGPGGAIYDLTIDASETNLTFAATEDTNYIVGTLVGVNLGGEIGGCKFVGGVEAYNESVVLSNMNMFYFGGLVGFSQCYNSYTGMIYGCSVDAYLSFGGSPIFAAGGIAGAIVGDDDAFAYVLNSKFNGNIQGRALKVGGIVGYMREFAAVANCMSEGKATSNVSDISPRSSYFVAGAGGIVGVADNEGAVTYCYSNMDLNVGQAAPAESVATRQNDCIGTVLAANTQSYDYRVVVQKGDSYVKNENADRETLLARMHWKDSEWDDDMNPKGGDYSDVNYTVTVNFGGKTVQNYNDDGIVQDYTVYNAEISNGYAQVYDLFYSDGLNALTATDDTVSYGFFFDAACTERVPAAMVLTEDITIYVGFADYGSLIDRAFYGTISECDREGRPTGVTTDIEFIFGEEGYKGRLTVRVGANVSYYMYVYDGENIVIHDINLNKYAFNEESFSTRTNEGATINARGELVIADGFWIGGVDGMAPAVVCVPATDAIGTWFAEDGAYTLNGNRTGTYVSLSGVTSQIEYTVDTSDGLKVTVTRGNDTFVGIVADDKITLENGDEWLKRSDEYRGVWVSDYNNRRTIEFDGKGGAKLGGAGTPYTYSVDENSRELTFSAGAASYSVKFNADGFLEVTVNGFVTVYGREGSMTGMWIDTVYEYWIEFEPIGRNGYGQAVDSDGYAYTYGDGGAMGDYALYNGGSMVGYGEVQMVDPVSGQAIGEDNDDNDGLVPMLWATLPNGGFMIDNLALGLVDALDGVWNSINGDTFEFNGYGLYAINRYADGSPWIMEGMVTVNGDDMVPVEYNYDYKNKTASFTYYPVQTPEGVTYNVVLTDDGITVNDIVCKHPDAISEYRYDAGDLLIRFNGKSNLGEVQAPNAKAIATITDAQGKEVQYDYTSDGFNATLMKDGTEKYKLVYTQDGETETYELLDVETQTRQAVGIHSEIMGKKYTVGDGVYLDLSEKFNFGATARATLISDDERINFTAIYITEKFIALYIGSSAAMFVQYEDEYTVSVFDTSGTLIGSACVEDGYQGTYNAVAQDSEIATIILDGRSHDSLYFGIALFVMSDGEEATYACEWQNGRFVIGDVMRQENTMILVPLYYVSQNAIEGAMQFKTDDNKMIYLTKAE